MNRSALLVMFALLLGAGAFAFFQKQGRDETERAKSPLETIDYSSVATISAQREDFARWTLEKRGSSLALRSEAIAGGRAVAGSPEIRARLLGFLQDAVWIEHRRVADLDLAEWGLDPAMIRVELRDAAGAHLFEVGRPDMNGDVWLRAPDGERAFKYPARVLNDLGLEPRWYRDPRLADIPAHLVTKIAVATRDQGAYELKRVGTTWFVEPEGGQAFRADPAFLDQLSVALANLSGVPFSGAVDESMTQPLFNIRVTGGGRECAYQILAMGQKGILARRGDEPDLRQLDRLLGRFFVADPSVLEDKRLLGVDFSEITGLQISGPGRADLRIARNADYWRVVFSHLLVRPVDAEAFRGLKEQLESARCAGIVPLPTDFESARRLEFEFDRDLEMPPLVIDFGVADSAGNRIVRRSDQAGALRLEGNLDDLLNLNYWDLMAHYFGSGSADEINEFSIRDPEGVKYQLRRETGTARWDLVDLQRDGETVPGFSPRPIPVEPLKGLLDRLAQISVPGFLGQRSDAELAKLFASPRYIISWKSPEMLLVPSDDPRAPRVTEEKVWEIGARLDDDRLHSRLSLFPALVFAVSGNDLLPVTDVLRVLRD